MTLPSPATTSAAPTAPADFLGELESLASALESCVAPYRSTRRGGHEALRGLLLDADTKPLMMVQIEQAGNLMDRARAAYERHVAQPDPAAAAMLHGIKLLFTELQGDMLTLVDFLRAEGQAIG